MNRFEYAEARMGPGETFITREKGIKLYDGNHKTSFESGEIVLTSHRLLWGRPGEIPKGLTCLALSLRYVILAEDEGTGFGFGRSKKVVLHLTEPMPGKNPGPINESVHNYIKLSFKEGCEGDFVSILISTLEDRKWESISSLCISQQASTQSQIKTRTGILGIERGIQEKQRATDDSISRAFQDLSKLMNMAKEMVNISKNISQKIREKQGDITEDETIRFKSYLLSLGIDDPVTRTEYDSDNQYFEGLAKQLSEMLLQPLTDVGGMMALTDVYCRVNRARGLELLSPEDLLHACHMFEKLCLPIRLREFDSGVKVLQLQSQSDEKIVKHTAQALEDQGSLTAAELAQSLGIAMLLAKERLTTTEKHGRACRDDSIEGLRFYPNLFLTRD